MTEMNLLAKDISQIRVAIAGMGKMGTYHVQALQQLARGNYEQYYKGDIDTWLRKINICGICDILPSRCRSVAGISAFVDFGRMLETAKPDLLIIAVPTVMHKTLALESLQRGIHTFVEKPIVTSSDDLGQLIAVAEKNGCRIMAGHVERYNPVSIKIKSLLKNAQPLPKQYEFTRTQTHHCRITDDIITDKVIHDLDLAICFFGPIRSVNVDSVKFSSGLVSEARILIEHQNSTTGTIFVSWLMPGEAKCRQVVFCQGGHNWKGDFAAKKLWVDDLEIICQVDGMVNASNNQIKDELVDFIATCCEGDYANILPLLSIEEIIEATRWLEYIKIKCSEITNAK